MFQSYIHVFIIELIRMIDQGKFISISIKDIATTTSTPGTFCTGLGLSSQPGT